jgi:hypothetical protein
MIPNTAPKTGLNWSTGGGNDPDQTFGAYVRELLASSKGFGGPFAGNQEQQTQATPQTKIVDGLFSKFLPGSGDREAINSTQGRPMSIAEQEALGFGLTQNAKALGSLGSLFGLPTAAGYALANTLGNYNLNQAMDRTSQAFDVFGAPQVPGVMTAYGPQGAYTMSTPESILASDIANFGGTAYGTVAGSEQSDMLAAQEAGMFGTDFGGGGGYTSYDGGGSYDYGGSSIDAGDRGE